MASLVKRDVISDDDRASESLFISNMIKTNGEILYFNNNRLDIATSHAPPHSRIIVHITRRLAPVQSPPRDVPRRGE